MHFSHTAWSICPRQDMSVPLRHSPSALGRPWEFELHSRVMQSSVRLWPYVHTGWNRSGDKPRNQALTYYSSQEWPLKQEYGKVRRGVLVGACECISLTLMFSNSLSVRTLVDWLTMVSREEWACSKESVLPRESHWRQRSTKFLWNRDAFVTHNRGTRTRLVVKVCSECQTKKKHTHNIL